MNWKERSLLHIAEQVNAIELVKVSGCKYKQINKTLQVQ